jgi:hypothetical protein
MGPERGRDAGRKSNSAVNDLPTGPRAELRHKDLRGAASTTCPPACNRRAAECVGHSLTATVQDVGQEGVCAEDRKAGADHMGGLRCHLGCVEVGCPRTHFARSRGVITVNSQQTQTPDRT